MAKTVRVRAGNNGPVFLPAPIQGQNQIADEPIEVESTRYIRRRIEVGDLVLADEDDEPTQAGTPPGTPAPIASGTFTPESADAAGDIHTTASKPRAGKGQ
jgi:hypothetical protein